MEHYEPLPSMPEDNGGPGARGFGGATGGDGDDAEAPLLDGSEQWEWEAVANLDTFFTRIYRYWEEKGFAVMLTARILNLLALAFTVAMSAMLLLYVNWGALQAECLRKDTCDIWEAAIRRHPLAGGLTPWTALVSLYLTLFSAYWLVALAHLLLEVRELAETRTFCNQRLGLSERQLATVTWPEVARRLAASQQRRRLCVARELSEHDIVARVMRRENYLIGMLNQGVLALNVPVHGFRRHFLLTKTLEWNLYWCVLDAMYDDHFRIKPAFLHNEAALKRRLRVLALANLAAAPFLLVFLLTYFFMKNAEKFYHHPSSVGARRWSPLAQWRLREFNELPHFIKHRLNSSHAAAEDYIRQFPSPILSHAARFVAFVAGSAAALLLAVTMIDERLLERDLFGRQLVWWMAVVGVVLALSRAFVIEEGAAFDPEAALIEVVAHTHYLPRHWRGRAHTREVQHEFEALFQYQALLFLEELASILLTPLLLWFSLPQCAGAVLSFVRANTVHVDGVGDVCSLAAFDFQARRSLLRHGDERYGSPVGAPKPARSRQGKMEKSFLSFAATYPAWEPDAAGQQLLQQVAAAPAALHAGQASLAWSMLPAAPPQPPIAAALHRRQAWRGPPLPPQHHLHKSMQAGRGGGAPDGVFASADLTAAETAAVAAVAADGPLDRVSASQLLLQSLYEQRQQAAQQGTQQAAVSVQQHQQPGPPEQQGWQQQQLPQAGAHPLAHAPNGAGPPQPQQPLHVQRGFAAMQAPMPIPQPAPQSTFGPRSPAAGVAAASPSPQQRVLSASGQQGVAASPRQSWLGRSPSGRARVAELSVLSRENSAVSRETSALPSPAAASAPMPAPQQQPYGSSAGARSLLSSPATSESPLQQQLLLGLQGSGLHSPGGGSGMHTSGGGTGGTGSDDQGPPEFF